MTTLVRAEAVLRPSSVTLLGDAPLSASHFERITQMLHIHCGIRMRPGKEGLVRARLTKRLRVLGLADFDAYLRLVESDPSKREFTEMVDALTTNKTSFYRESAHFRYLREVALPACPGPIRIWSAGCSTGEEPYTLAMLLHETLPASAVQDARILATDISHRVLGVAKTGRYPVEALAEAPRDHVAKHWRTVSDGATTQLEAGASLRALVHFGRLNLMEPWPMRGPFDAILCRNVMIYFDKATQQQLVERYWAMLRPGGHFFVGHSESLTGLSHQFRYVQPAVYVK